MTATADPIVDHNRRGWDALVGSGHVLTRSVDADELSRAAAILDPVGWLEGDCRGRRVLCLAAGGGRFSALFAALGAVVTVIDISAAMLDVDRQTATRFGLNIRCIQADMCDLRQCDDAEFDLIMQPVSTTYVPGPRFAFAEAARVIAAGGLYISFHKQPMNLQVSLQPGPAGYIVEHPAGTAIRNPAYLSSRLREAGTIEHAHSLQSILGGICRSGFVIEDVVEPQYGELAQPPGSFKHRCSFVPPYIAVKARRQETAAGKRLIMG